MQDIIRLPCRKTYLCHSQLWYCFVDGFCHESSWKEKSSPKLTCALRLPIAHSRMSSLIDILVALSILMGYSVTTASFVTCVVRGIRPKAKQLQHISGISVTCYWVTNFIYDIVSHSSLQRKTGLIWIVVVQLLSRLCLIFCDPMDCSTTNFPSFCLP